MVIQRMAAGTKGIVKPLEYKIVRNEKSVLLKTNAITYVAGKYPQKEHSSRKIW